MSLLDARQSKPMEGGASFSLGNRLVRAVWGLAWLVLARWTPPPLWAWRRMVLRAFGAKIGKGARVYGATRVWLPANLTLGDRALIGPGVHLYNQGHITIGAYSVISQGTHICASSHDIRDPDFQLVLRPIVIGERCWVAAEAFVGPGVVMGDRSVLAARGALFGKAEADSGFVGSRRGLLPSSSRHVRR